MAPVRLHGVWILDVPLEDRDAVAGDPQGPLLLQAARERVLLANLFVIANDFLGRPRVLSGTYCAG